MSSAPVGEPRMESLLLSNEMFMLLFVWTAIVTLLIVIALVAMCCYEDASLRRLRDAHHIRQRSYAQQRKNRKCVKFLK